MRIGFLGLGHMGLNYVKNILDGGSEVVAWNRSEGKREQARSESTAIVVDTISEVFEKLNENISEPRIIFSLIAAGSAIDSVLFNEETGLVNYFKEGDIFVDMANSHYQDSISRSKKLAEIGVKMLDVGISGGVTAARNGASIMIGGDESAFKLLEPIFKHTAQENGYGYFGAAGAGHFVKMVHNGIEYGMMQAIGEGVGLISAKEDYSIDLVKLLQVWNNGAIIESNLIGYLHDAISEPGNNNLENEEAEIGSLGTGRWTAEEALKLGVPLTVITNAVYARYSSRLPEFIGYKAVSAMRRIFGAHSSTERPSN